MKLLRLILCTLFLASCQYIPVMAASADKDHQTLGDSASKATDFAIQKVNSLIDAASKALPTATKYAMEVTSMDCLISVLYWLLILVITVTLWTVVYKAVQKGYDNEWQDEGVCVPVIIISCVCGFIGFITSNVVFATLDIWKFVCVIHPDLYLIHLAVQKILGS